MCSRKARAEKCRSRVLEGKKGTVLGERRVHEGVRGSRKDGCDSSLARRSWERVFLKTAKRAPSSIILVSLKLREEGGKQAQDSGGTFGAPDSYKR